MKLLKTILSLSAVILVAACARVQTDYPGGEEIRFQVASYGTPATKAGETDYKQDYGSVPFGAYAWYKGETPAENRDFMVNQKVSYNSSDNLWITEGSTYYWPKGGSLDFICYSPYSTAGVPAIGEDSITYTDYDVNANPDTDLLYADKSCGLGQNAVTYYYNGVPVLFRHALARLSFSLRLAYSEITATTGDKTKWEVTVNSISIKNVRTSGSLSIGLESGAWALPASQVWTPNAATTDIALDCSALHTFTDTNPQDVGSGFMVLPQSLGLGQKLILNLTINTWRDNGSGYGTEPFVKETSVEVEAAVGVTTLDKWGINQNIHYNLILTPSLSDGSQLPTEITFDPAVADWENITTTAEINI